jgi:AraC-like DNA-binding protein
MDVLADVLEVTQMANTVLCQAELRAPWGIAVDPSAEAALHVVQRGSCWLRVDGRAPMRLGDGDVVLLARGSGHAISDEPDRPLRGMEETLREMAARIEGGEPADGVATTQILCAKYRFGLPGDHPLVSRLPQLIHLRSREVGRSAQLQLLIQLMKIESEARGSGSELVVPRLVDSLLVFILRVWLETEPGLSASWFAALRDSGIARALALIHREPHADWTVQSLADRAGQTRATFARRFAMLVGETPVAYLTRWRICLAAKAIREGAVTVEQAAFSAGYDSAPAFSRAFKRQYGMPPTEFRAANAV